MELPLQMAVMLLPICMSCATAHLSMGQARWPGQDLLPVHLQAGRPAQALQTPCFKLGTHHCA